MEGGSEGLKFYLIPDVDRLLDAGVTNVIAGAMSQAFFTLSLGIGSMSIFGSYISKDRSLTGESASICLLDTFVAFAAGLVIFPACFAFGVNPGEGPGLVFVTLPNIFNQMAGGRLWGTLFFIYKHMGCGGYKNRLPFLTKTGSHFFQQSGFSAGTYNRINHNPNTPFRNRIASTTPPAMHRDLSEMVKQLVYSSILGSISAILKPSGTG